MYLSIKTEFVMLRNLIIRVEPTRTESYKYLIDQKLNIMVQVNHVQ